MSLFLIGDSITLTLLVLLILIFVYYVYNLRTNNIFRRTGMPGPAPIPLLGEMFNVMRRGMYKNDTALVKKYGKIIGVYEGTTPVILLSDPDILRNVLIKDSHVFINRRTIEGAAGPLEHGLTALKDEQWKNARSIVSPTFSTAKLKAMHSLMNDVSDMYNERLLEYADQQEIFDIKTINGQYTLDNIASCLFGVETNSLKNENITLINHLRKFFTISLANIFVLVILLSPRLAGYLGKKGYSILPMDAIEYTTNIVNQVLARRRQRLERRNDFIQMMIDHEDEIQTSEQKDQEGQQSKSLKKTLSDKEILSQALVFLIAGYETTSVLMSFFFYVMATEPIIQEKIYQEIRQEIGDDEVTYEKLNQLQYLDMVINETLRMYPPFIRFDRVASKDYQLGNYLIPKGSIINVPVYPIHHDSEVWPEPEKFIPESNCIGMRFALVEAKLGIIRALRLVEFERCEKTEIPIQLGNLAILNSKNGISPRFARYLYTKGYSILPKNIVDYLTELLNQILNLCRQHLERRNDFIQMMVDHDDQVKHDEQEQQQIGTLTKSNMLKSTMHHATSVICIFNLS
ncbi:unnamed protein product [Adineta steineri]|uniref:Uncharacterized protein n=1 Tax=Adineta steineri TaxID=433720 RepID=A0A815IG12_9BILA|nr:unnamed protein product [Adineta steineri]